MSFALRRFMFSVKEILVSRLIQHRQMAALTIAARIALRIAAN